MHHLTLQGLAMVGCWSSSTAVWPTLLSCPGLCSTWSSPSAPSYPGPPAITTGIQVRQPLLQSSGILSVDPLMTEKKILFQSFVFQAKMTQAIGATRPTQPLLPLNSGSMLMSQSNLWAISRSRLVVIIFFLPDDGCWLSQEALRRLGVYDGRFYCV